MCSTQLSRHLCSLKLESVDFKLSWKVIAKSNAYSNSTKKCNLCLTERRRTLFCVNLIYAHLTQGTS